MFQVPAYVAAQLFGSILASGTLKLLFHGKEDQFVGTIPSGSDTQAFVVEFIITFYLMFVISGVATDNRAVSFPSISSLFSVDLLYLESSNHRWLGGRYISHFKLIVQVSVYSLLLKKLKFN